MLKSCAIDFSSNLDRHLPLAEFTYNNSYEKSIQLDPFEALYGRKCRTLLCWCHMYEKRNLGPDLVREIEDKVKLICERLKTTSDRQKSFADLRHRDVEYQVLRFGWIRPIAYYLLFPPEFKRMHDVFHVSMLRKYRSGPSHVFAIEEIEVRFDLLYEEELVAILGRKVKVLHNKMVPLVKVLWRNHKTDEAT
ncbi:uncharacterized protein [Gossypium hirsutum]|uniref:Tf2-1-like SH3-like domain-containing protein n=1 Tax=Gossypium hirsutum TaxID=3635 RepID=A0A1U8I4V0_GOSHI|nr:uncharacterized protein LOC107892709 [Gossypium hirsutum]